MATSFLALYHGKSIKSAQLIAVSSDPTVVAEFAERLLQPDTPHTAASADPVIAAINQGRRDALQAILKNRSSVGSANG